MVWFLVLCPDDANQDSVVYGAEFGVVFLAKGPRIHTGGPRLPRPLPFGSGGRALLSVGRRAHVSSA